MDLYYNGDYGSVVHPGLPGIPELMPVWIGYFRQPVAAVVAREHVGAVIASRGFEL